LPAPIKDPEGGLRRDMTHRAGTLSRREFSALVAGVGGASLWACQTTGADRSINGVIVGRDVLISMRDGVRLACDVHRPARDGQPVNGSFPVILERTPYGKHLPSRTERSLAEIAHPRARDAVASTFVMRGYIVVYQDVRGRYGSAGEFVKYLDDADDGYDTCQWILAQAWCDGRIATKGFSYAAHTQGALASAGAPGVAAMFIDSGAFSNSYQGGIRQGGTYELKQVTWAYRNALVSPEIEGDPAARQALESVDLHDWFNRMPWRPGHSPLVSAPAYEAYMFELWEHGNFHEYWKRPGIYAEGFYDQFPDVPTVHVSSWFDPYPRTATDNFMALSKRKQSPTWLVLGPWTHGNRSQTHAGDVDFGPSATWDGNVSEDYWVYRNDFFDRYLLGKSNGFDRQPGVRFFVMGGGTGRRNADGRMDHGGRWRTADDWPVPGTTFTNYYLHADGLLAEAQPSAAASARTYVYDPGNPVPSIGGTITSGAPIMEGGAYDQREGPEFFGSRPPFRPLAERSDVLVFQTAPLQTAVEIAGPLEVTLWIASDAPDTDFTAKLVDVYPPNEDYPDGYAMNITDGILRCRYRDSWESPELMEPGRVYRITIAAFPSSNLFAAGHRIRIDVSSSNFPHFDLNFNTGEPEGRASTRRIARNTVYMDTQQPSHVVLPILPA